MIHTLLYNREQGTIPRSKLYHDCKYNVNTDTVPFSPNKFIEKASCSARSIRRMKVASVFNKQGHSGCVNTVNWNQRGDIVISGSDDTQIICWNAMEASKLVQFESRHRGNIFCALFMPFTQDSKIISCARDGAIHYFDLMKNQTNTTQYSDYDSCCFSLKNSKMSSPFVRAFEDHTDSVHKLVVEPNSSYVFLSCSQDGTSRIYDLRAPNMRDNILVDLRGSKNALTKRNCDLDTISINERNPYLVAVAGGDPYVRLYDRRKNTAECVQVFSTSELIRASRNPDSLIPVHITGIRFDENRNQIAASYSGNSIYTFQVDDVTSSDTSVQMVSGIAVTTDYCKKFSGHRNVRTVKEVHYLGANNNFVISGSDCGRVFFYDNRENADNEMEDEGEENSVIYMAKGDKHVVNALAPHPSGSLMLATSGIENDVKLWLPIGDYEKATEEMQHAHEVTDENGRLSRQFGAASRNPLDLLRQLRLLIQLGGFPDSEEEEQDEMSEEFEEEDEEEEEEEPTRTIPSRIQLIMSQLNQVEEEEEDEEEED